MIVKAKQVAEIDAEIDAKEVVCEIVELLRKDLGLSEDAWVDKYGNIMIWEKYVHNPHQICVGKLSVKQLRALRVLEKFRDMVAEYERKTSETPALLRTRS